MFSHERYTECEDGRKKLPISGKTAIRKAFREWVDRQAKRYGVCHMTIRRALTNKKAQDELKRPKG